MEIDNLIKTSLKEKNFDKVYVYRMVKAKFLENDKSKNKKDEVSVINKMIKEWQEEIDILNRNNRDTSNLNLRLNILKELVPKPATIDEIKEVLKDYLGPIEISNASGIIHYVKSFYENVNNKDIIDYIKAYDK